MLIVKGAYQGGQRPTLKTFCDCLKSQHPIHQIHSLSLFIIARACASFKFIFVTMKSLLSHPPLQEINDSLLTAEGVRLLVKRDDLIHKQIQGNKWRKLEYNLEEARCQEHKLLITFGGPFSNHIYATAAAANLFGFKCIGVIRGERPASLSPTLQFAEGKGMHLHFVNRETYRLKETEMFLRQLQQQFGEFYAIPEGGTNMHALKGVEKIIGELDVEFDYLATPCGTGGTIAGLLTGLKGEKQVIGFSSLKGHDKLTAAVDKLVQDYAGTKYHNFKINFDYHFGGYAKVNGELIQFIKDFKTKYGIQLEPVYTGKMFYGLFDMIKSGRFERGSTIIALHTGGLQGLCGYPEYFDSSVFEEFF